MNQLSLAAYSKSVLLKDGGAVLLRAIRPSDKAGIDALFHDLSDESRRFRVFGAKSALTPRELTYLTELDFVSHVGLAAVLRENGAEHLVGAGRYCRVDALGKVVASSHLAEIAFSVIDADHGRGIGTLLLEHLAAIARDQGVTELEADVLMENAKMMTVFRESGFAIERSIADGHYHVKLSSGVTDGLVRATRMRAVHAAAEEAHRSLRDELATPRAFPEPRPDTVDVVETHGSWVFLGGNDVMKVKKPVNFGFLDFSTIERRKDACDAEVVLNRRLAPNTYKGVVAVKRQDDGTLRFGGDGELVDWAVHMVRLSDDRRADCLLASGALSVGIVDRVAERIAVFHKGATCDDVTSAYGAIDAIAKNVTENFAQTRDIITSYIRADEADAIETWQLAFLRKHVKTFAERVAARRIRDGHGDLRLEHVYAGNDGGLTIIDCIEFNERFRYGDVCADVAFLAMDLAWHERVDLAERCLARYARAADDFDLYAVVDFYESYRAYVRGKVAAILAADVNADASLRSRAVHDARRYFLLALAAQSGALITPSVVCVGGMIASGKSSVADAIAMELGAPVVDADRTRKHMLGIDPNQHVNDAAWMGAYDPTFTTRVYVEVLRRAGVVLASGRPVVIDASFRSVEQRDAARAHARTHGAPIGFLECRADDATCRARLAQRETTTGVSDGRLAIFAAFAAQFEPMTELPPSEHVVVDSSGRLDATVAAARRDVQAWPRGLVA